MGSTLTIELMNRKAESHPAAFRDEVFIVIWNP